MTRGPEDSAGPAPAGSASAARAVSLWRQHRRWVAAVLLAHMPRGADLDDLLQSVALALVREIDEIRGGDGAVRPWLRTVAINAARAAGRKGAVRARGLQRVAQASAGERFEHTPDEAGVTGEEGRRLMALALELPEKYREPLLLRCVHGMSYRQIGEVTGLPESTIETRIARGRRMLREAADAAATTTGQRNVAALGASVR